MQPYFIFNVFENFSVFIVTFYVALFFPQFIRHDVDLESLAIKAEHSVQLINTVFTFQLWLT